MAISSTYYLDSEDLATATAVYLDLAFTVLAPDGFYSDGTISREQYLGVLLDPVPCPGCDDCTCYSLSSILDFPYIGNTVFNYIDCFTNEPDSITVFTDNPVDICAKTGSIIKGGGDPGIWPISTTDCCTLTCQCYTVTWLQPTTEPWFGFTNFDYKNCDGTIIEATVSEFGPPLNICVQAGYSIRIDTSTPNDESMEVSEAVEDCCYIPLALRTAGDNEGEISCSTESPEFVNFYIYGADIGCLVDTGYIALNTNSISDTFNGLNKYYLVYLLLCGEELGTYLVQIGTDGYITVIENCPPPP